MVAKRAVSVAAFAILLMTAAPLAQQRPVFRSVREMVLVDVVVRDRSGVVVKGLKAGDFEILEDGKPQEVLTFSFQETNTSAKAIDSAALLAGVDSKLTAATTTAKPTTPTKPTTPATPPAAVEPAPADPVAFNSDELAGRRLMILLFDLSSMQPEDVQRSIDSAKKYVETKMSP